MLVHLRMTGWFEFARPAQYRVMIQTDKADVYFEDRRRLGVVRIVSPGELRGIVARLGPEPLERGFSLAALTQTSRAVKVALLDQRIVAGLGNIYASESLWRARLHPLRASHRLQPGERIRLERSVRATLRRAISYGDTIFSAAGTFAVYQRKGKPCRRCGTAVRRIVQAQRSTYFCPGCQRR